MNDETSAGAANLGISSNAVDALLDRLWEDQSIGIRRPQELDSENVGDDDGKDKGGEHDAFLMQMFLSKTQLLDLTFTRKGDVFLLQNLHS